MSTMSHGPFACRRRAITVVIATAHSRDVGHRSRSRPSCGRSIRHRDLGGRTRRFNSNDGNSSTIPTARLRSRCSRSSAPGSWRSTRSGSTPKRVNRRGYSHSIVAGGFDVTSSTTRFTPGISLTIRAGDRLDQVVREPRPVGGHRVVARDRADHDRVAVRALVALHADRADRRQHGERLPELAVETGAAHLLLEDRVGLAQDLEPLRRDVADDPDREARARGTAGARPSAPASRAPRRRGAPRP